MLNMRGNYIMNQKENIKSNLEEKTEECSADRQIKIKKRRKAVIIIICCITLCLTFFSTPTGKLSIYIIVTHHKETKEYIKNNFISRDELEEIEIYLNQSSDYFAAKAKELKGLDPNIYEIDFCLLQQDSSAQIELCDDNYNLINKLYIDVPEDVFSTLDKVSSHHPYIYVYENEIQFNYWDMETGGYHLSRSLNKGIPTERCKDGLYFYVKDGWWNFCHRNTLWEILF